MLYAVYIVYEGNVRIVRIMRILYIRKDFLGVRLYI